MVKTVLKQLPNGDYIQLPENYTGLDLLAEVCTLEREKLENLIEKQQELVVVENNNVLSSTSNKPPKTVSPDSVLHSNKRTWETSDDDEEDDNNNNNKKKKRKKAAAMPVDFRNKILQLAGPNAMISEENLLIQKTLTSSDVAKTQNRLSIPTKQLRDNNVKFLSDEEERLLASHDGTNVGSLDNVMIIEPSLETSRVSFRMWEMRKTNGSRSSISYVITKTWNGIKERHNLEEGMTVQVWAIRVDQQLWLALVKLPASLE